MKNKTKSILARVLKSAILIISIYLIFKYIGTNKYDRVETCILKDAGVFLAGFIIPAFILLFFEKTRSKTLDILKVYVPAFFILYSGLFYIDTIQYDQNINTKKEYITLKLQSASIEAKNIPKKEFDNIISEYKSAVEEYNNKILNGYKTIIGKAMIGLTIGSVVILIMELLKIQYKKEKAK